VRARVPRRSLLCSPANDAAITGHKGSEKCDVRAALVFIIGLVAGTGCTIASKALFQMHAVGSNGQLQLFKPPLFQTWVMFIGMAFALPAHFLNEWYRRKNATPAELKLIEAEPAVTTHTYALLAVPSIFDLLSTCLMVVGLLHTNASIWMLLRGGGIVFVALMKQYVLHDKLSSSMWAGVGIIAFGVACVGCASMVGATANESDGDSTGDALFGVLMTLAGTFMQSVQYVYEEKVMSGDVSAPPWLLIGVEGVTGTLLSTFVLYPLFWLLPGDDNGSYEDPINTFTMLQNSPTCLALALAFCVLVFILNSFSVLVTYMMSSVWHAILDNFRPVTIWTVQLTIYYVFSQGQYGEAWTDGSYLQLFGMSLLLAGTAVYNGSIKLPCLAADKSASLLDSSSTMASSALARSPLITHNRAAFMDSDARSPYVSRIAVDAERANPMVLGVSTGKREPLLSGR
jgi:drug/metabolite transporter (DMT)-like permease